MKYYIHLISILISSFLMAVSSNASSPKILAEGFDSKNINLFPKIKLEKGVLECTVLPNEWNYIAETPNGVLKNGGQYEVEFKVKILDGFDVDKKLEFVVRPRTGYEQWGDVALVNRFGETSDWQSVRIRFDVPNNGKQYSIYFYARKHTRLELKDFVLREGDFLKNIPVLKDTPKSDIDLGKLPTGAKDFNVEFPKPEKVQIVDAADFGMSEDSQANASALNRAIEHCKKIGASKLVVKKGIYKFFEEDVTIAFVNMKDFTFDGGGSTFIFRRKSVNKSFYIENLSRARIRNFNVDWDWDVDPLAAIVKIINSGKDAKNGDFFDVEYVEYAGDTYPLYNKPTRVASMSPWDLKNMTVGEEFGQEAWYGYNCWFKGPKTEWLDKNVMRIYAPVDSKKTGKYYRLQHFYYESDCIVFGKCENLSFEKINIYSCRGAAFYGVRDNKYVQLVNSNVKLPTKVRRPITSTADHFYISCPKGFVKVLGCEFSYGADDCFNIHGPTIFGKKIGDSTLSIMTSKGVECFDVGSTVELMDAKYLPFNKTLKVKKFTNKGNGIFELEFDGKLPEERKGGFTLLNPEYCTGNAILRDCYFHDNRARGILLLSRDITVENCRFKHNEMIGVRMETGYAIGIWSEGVFSQNIVVRNCTFESENSTGTTIDGYSCDIMSGSYMRSYSAEQADYPVTSDVLFENNTFINSFGLIAKIASAKNMIFKDNTFINDSPRLEEKDYRACFYIRDSSDIKIINNTWIASPYVVAPRVIVDSSAKNVVSEGNKTTDKN